MDLKTMEPLRRKYLVAEVSASYEELPVAYFKCLLRVPR